MNYFFMEQEGIFNIVIFSKKSYMSVFVLGL